MYPGGLIFLYSNMTPRSYKRIDSDYSVFFGLQYYIKAYLMDEWQTQFFDLPKDDVVKEYNRFHKNFSGCDVMVEHIEKLHDLSYMPIEIRALDEGVSVPAKVPYFVIFNTHKDFAWLVNFLETQISTVTWDFSTNATIAKMYRTKLDKWAEKTGDPGFVQWQGHDFSMRGRSSMESTYNQAGHLLSFTGTDTIPAVYLLEQYYNADMEKELIGGSVPASEHSIQTSYGKEKEIDGFSRILDIFPEGVVSIVSDSFDLWKVCTEYVVTLKDKILARNGKLVIRPDSGDPVDIVCGLNTNSEYDKDLGTVTKEQAKGVVELLWDVFGGTVNDKGYKVLDPHIGVIYGDSITLDRAEQICARLAAKGFASTNVVLGIGSYTYNYNTRDTLGMAIKSTYCEVYENGQIEQREIFKDPTTDDGLKKSAKGLMVVEIVDGEYVLKDQQNKKDSIGQVSVSVEGYVDDEGKFIMTRTITNLPEIVGELKPVFSNGVLLKDHTLAEVRARVEAKKW
jgi:nicotinamide phosphoribosyltransferase